MRCLEENEGEACIALSKDLRKCKQEAITNEIEMVRNELRNYCINLREYAKTEWVKVEIALKKRRRSDRISFSRKSLR